MIVIGKAAKGGDIIRSQKVIDLAAQDLDSKIDGANVTALAIYQDEANVYIVANVEQKKGIFPEKKKK